MVEAVLAYLEPEFDAMYAATGRHSVPPEQLLKATVLMALYAIRSERQFCERLRYDLLFKFFLDLNVDAEGFDHSTWIPGRAAEQRNPPLDHRPRGAAGPQGELGGSQAQLRGAPAHGEPVRPDRPHGSEPGDRLR